MTTSYNRIAGTAWSDWRRAVGQGHLKPDTPPELNQSIESIVLVQLNFAMGLLSRF
jgi:hypothetical protein